MLSRKSVQKSVTWWIEWENEWLNQLLSVGFRLDLRVVSYV